MKINNINISLENNIYILEKNGYLEKLVSEKDIIHTIFWYPILEMRFSDFDSKVNEAFLDVTFPYLLLIKNVVQCGSFYWVRKALEWYKQLDFNIFINSFILDCLSRKGLTQEDRNKLKKILSSKYKEKAQIIFSSDTEQNKEEFTAALNSNQIQFKEINDNIIIVGNQKFQFR